MHNAKHVAYDLVHLYCCIHYIFMYIFTIGTKRVQSNDYQRGMVFAEGRPIVNIIIIIIIIIIRCSLSFVNRYSSLFCTAVNMRMSAVE